MKKLFLLLITIVIFFNNNIYSTHIAGSDLTYKYIGKNAKGQDQYLVRLTYYRDCSGAAMVLDPWCIEVTADNGTTILDDSTAMCSNLMGNPGIPLKLIKAGGEITPICPNAKTTCTGGTNYGIEELIWEGIVTLPSKKRDWVLSGMFWNRNPATTTNSNGKNQVIEIQAKINNLDFNGGNSSPQFSNKPITVVCVNQLFCFNHGASEVDGDSLVYTFAMPKGNVLYLAGYDSLQPFKSNPPVKLDHITGDLCLTPTKTDVGPLAIKVSEYRKDSTGKYLFVGSVIRDMQMNIIVCTNNMPEISGMTQKPTYDPKDLTYYIEVRPGQKVDFLVNGFDKDTSSVLIINTSNAIKNSTFLVTGNGSSNPSGHFSWTPTPSDRKPSPHCFTSTIRDQACPFFGSQTYAYCIKVKGAALTIFNDTTLCQGSIDTITVKGDVIFKKYVWELDQKPLNLPVNTLKYILDTKTMTLGKHILVVSADDGTKNNTGTDTIEINIIASSKANIGIDTLLCADKSDGSDVKFDLDATYSGASYYYLWNTSETTAKITVGGFTGIKTFSVTITSDSVGKCPSTDTIKINIVPKPILELGKDTSLCSSSLVLNAGNNGFSYLWSTTETTNSITVNKDGLYKVTAYANVHGNCPNKDSINVTFLPIPKVNLGADTCSSKPFVLDGKNSDYKYTYNWKVDNINLPEHSQTINIVSGGKYYLTVTSKSTDPQCEAVGSKNVTMIPDPTVNIGTDTLICKHQEITLNAYQSQFPNVTYIYKWYDGSTDSKMIIKGNDAGTKLIPDVNKFWVDVFGCGPISDTIIVRVDPCAVEIPNVMTPNGDAMNDKFFIRNLEKYPKSKVVIYSRWGNKVYENNDYLNDWTGGSCIDGVYYYILTLSDSTTYHGTITIIGKE